MILAAIQRFWVVGRDSSIRLFVYSSIRLFVYSSIRLFVYSSIRLFVYSSIRLFVYSSIRLFVYSSIRLFVYSSIRLFVYSSIRVTTGRRFFPTSCSFLPQALIQGRGDRQRCFGVDRGLRYCRAGSFLRLRAFA